MNPKRGSPHRALTAFIVMVLMSSAALGQDIRSIKLTAERIVDHVYMIGGGYGNIGVLEGEDGLLLVDTKSMEFVDAINTALSEISDQPVRYVINTHWHFDHVGGNEHYGKAGAVIIAHENVRKRISTEQYIEFFDNKISPEKKAALPVITFTQGITMHFNDETIDLFHEKPGHTDGDVIVYFRKANVIHMGDVYFNGMYPYIGIATGGTIHGMIEVVNHILPMIDDSTPVIPGHGPLSNKKELKEYVSMLTGIRDRISRQIADGKTLQETIAAKPTKPSDAKGGRGFMNPDKFTELVYKDLSKQAKVKN